jgi:predicted CXXCH cytochrome family protein
VEAQLLSGLASFHRAAAPRKRLEVLAAFETRRIYEVHGVTNPVKVRPGRYLTILVPAVLVFVAAAQTPPLPAGTGYSAPTSSKAYPAPVNLKVLPGNLSGRQVHDLMEKWSGELGVRCVKCHVLESDAVVSGGASSPRFADDSKPMKGIARQMYTMTEAINSGYIRNVNGENTPVTCGTCHRGHVTPEPFFALSDPQVCTNCHTAVAGPFRFEHAVVKAEGCTACHSPHGGANPHLLIRADVDAVCQQCHLPSPDPATGAHMKSDDIRPGVPQTCISCHVDIHGSNSSMVFLGRQ